LECGRQLERWQSGFGVFLLGAGKHLFYSTRHGERSPATTNAVFPGELMVVEGNGVLVDGGGTAFATQTTTGELRLKESGTANATNYGTVYAVGGTVTFPDLQLNGGQIDNGSSSAVVINGENQRDHQLGHLRGQCRGGQHTLIPD